MHLRIALVAGLAITAVAPASAEPLPRAGGLGRGISVDPLELGASQAFSRGGASYGVRAAIGVQIDLGPRWAVRMPVIIDATARGDDVGYSELSLVPGVIYRLRSDADQRWVPFAGGGIKLGAWGAHLGLLDKPLVVPRVAPALLDWDWEDDDGDGHGDSDPNVVVETGAGVELWAGAEWRPARWFALAPELTYALVRVDGVVVHAVSESVTVRFTL
jgi:hypothetical protein